nr:hypothetical protein [Sphingopyxis sp. RIFCSPHIGHO2_12_FULL_65_19]
MGSEASILPGRHRVREAMLLRAQFVHPRPESKPAKPPVPRATAIFRARPKVCNGPLRQVDEPDFGFGVGVDEKRIFEGDRGAIAFAHFGPVAGDDAADDLDPIAGLRVAFDRLAVVEPGD